MVIDFLIYGCSLATAQVLMEIRKLTQAGWLRFFYRLSQLYFHLGYDDVLGVRKQ